MCRQQNVKSISMLTRPGVIDHQIIHHYIEVRTGITSTARGFPDQDMCSIIICSHWTLQHGQMLAILLLVADCHCVVTHI